MQVSGPGFAQEVRLFLGGACPPGWVEANETMGMLLASRGVSEEAGTNKSKAGILASYIWYDDGGSGRGNERQVTLTAPSSFLLLLCKRA